MKRKRILPTILAIVVLAGALMFAAVALGIWQEKSIHRDGAWHAVSGTYTDTPEAVQFKQISGPCSNGRVAVFANSGNFLVWQEPTAVAMCPLNTVLTYTYSNSAIADYPGGTYIAVVAGPADGQTIGMAVNGVQKP